MSNRHETFSRIIEVLDSVPGVNYEVQVQPFLPLDVLVYWKIGFRSKFTVVDEKEAEEITEEEIASLAIELTFGHE